MDTDDDKMTKIKDAHDLEIDPYNTVRNSINNYKIEKTKVPIIEGSDNAWDANAKRVTISFDSEYMIIHNDGEVMSDSEFKEYQVFSSSSKNPGDQIGLAGQGAKLILGAPYDVELETISVDKNDGINAVYFDNGTESNRRIIVKSDSDYTPSDKITNMTDSVGKSLQKHIKESKVGTTQYIKLPKQKLDWVKKNTTKIVEDYYMLHLIKDNDDSLEFYLGDKKIKPSYDFKVYKEKTFSLKDKNGMHAFTCNFYTTNDFIPESANLTNTVFTTYGKRVKTRRDATIEMSLDDKYRNKVICIAECDSLAKHVITSKEDFFNTEKLVIDAHKKIADLFREFVRDNSLTRTTTSKNPITNVAKQIVQSACDLITNLGYSEILPEAVDKRVIARAKSGPLDVSAEKRKPGQISTTRKIGTEKPTGRINKPKGAGNNKGPANYFENEYGKLAGREQRKRVTGIPKVVYQNTGIDNDAVYLDVASDSLVFNLDQEPFKSTKGKHPDLYHMHTRYLLITWIVKNASDNNELNWTAAEQLAFWENVHKKNWVN